MIIKMNIILKYSLFFFGLILILHGCSFLLKKEACSILYINPENRLTCIRAK